MSGTRLERYGRAALAGLCLAAVGLAASGGFSGALAQAPGCAVRQLADPPPRQVLSCADGLTITAESTTAYRLIDRNQDGRPEGAELTGRALLVDGPPRRGGFQILTPHAIAAVRGTVWAIDVTAERTSVFVKEGAVAVRRPQGRAVTLRAGDGVDVDAGGGPLEVKQWGQARAAALLARFGR